MARSALGWSLLAMPVAVIGIGSAWAWPFTVDDAYVVASYAHQLSTLGRYGLDGTQTSDGVTGPLWIAPFLLAELLGLDPVSFAKFLGGVCGAAAVGLVVLRLRRRTRGWQMALAAGVLCAVQSDLAVWAVGGLETGIATLLLVGAALASTSATPRLGALGVCVGLLAWLRPELAPASAVLLLFAWCREGRRAWIALCLAALGGFGVLLFRFAMFGHWLPLSLVAKPAELTHGVHYVANALVLTTGMVGIVPFVRGIQRGRSGERWIGSAVIAHVVALVVAGGDWMPGHRLLVPVLPLYAWVAAVGALRTPSARRGSQGLAMLALSCLVPLASLVVQLPRARASGVDRETRGAELAAWLASRACRVAMVDVGYVTYAGRLRVLDLAGITDERVGRMQGGHVQKPVTDELLRERGVDTLVLRATELRTLAEGLSRLRWHSVTESLLARSPEVRRRYRLVHVVPYAEHYVYYVLRTEPTQLCPMR